MARTIYFLLMISSTMLKGKYTAHKSIHLATRIILLLCALEGVLQCSSCPISVSRTGVKTPVVSHKGENDGIVTTASGMYMWFSMTQIFRNG